MSRLPDEPTTLQQWQVIAWTFILLFLAGGSVALYFSCHAPPQKLPLAQALRTYSLGLYTLGGAVYVLKRTVEWLAD